MEESEMFQKLCAPYNFVTFKMINFDFLLVIRVRIPFLCQNITVVAYTQLISDNTREINTGSLFSEHFYH